MEKKNGVIETYYDNGQLKSRSNHENGKLNGLWETWHKNGQLQESAMYKDGVVE